MKRSLPSIIAAAILAIILGLYMVTYQVRFNEVAVVRTFGKIAEPKPKVLFTVPDSVRAELDQARVPDLVRKEFARLNELEATEKLTEYGRTDLALTGEAKLTVDSPGQSWRLEDGEQAYILSLHNGEITVGDLNNTVSKDVKKEPGLYFKWPWPIQQVELYDNRLQMTETTGEETPTRDTKNVIVTTAIGWRIDDPYWFNIKNKGMQDAEEKLKSRVRNDQKTIIANYDFANFVSTDESELKYDEIERQIREAVAKRARKDYSVRVEYIGIDRLALPKRITENVFKAMQEERNAQAARYTTLGEAEAQRIKTEAKAIAGTILAFAQRKADEIRAEGLRRAAEYNTTFSKDQELAIFLLKIKYLVELLKERSTIILNAEPPFDLLKGIGGEGTSAAATTRPAGSSMGSGPGPGLSGKDSGLLFNVPTPELIKP